MTARLIEDRADDRAELLEPDGQVVEVLLPDGRASIRLPASTGSEQPRELAGRARIASLLARRLFRGLVLPPSALVVLPYAADKLARVVLERIESNLNAAGAAQQPRGTWNEPTNL